MGRLEGLLCFFNDRTILIALLINSSPFPGREREREREREKREREREEVSIVMVF